MAKDGLYKNIHQKRKRIENGADERMKRKGEKGRPSDKDFKRSGKTGKTSLFLIPPDLCRHARRAGRRSDL